MREVTILLVDDEPDLLSLTSTYLQRIGYAILAASDAQNALQLIDKHAEIDLVITDILMPNGINGLELGRHVANLYPGVPVIYTSGYVGGALKHELDEIGPGRMLQKPYRLRELTAIIHRALSRDDLTGDHLH